MVAASRYSSALARKPSGGAGSSMRSTSSPCAAIAFTYCDSGRCTNGSITPGASSSIVTSTGRYGADAPVLLLEDVIDHPAAVRRLQQRVVEEEQEPAAGREHAGDLRDRRGVIGQVLEHQARDRGVERRVGERQMLGAGPQVARTAGSLRGRDGAAHASGRPRPRTRRRASSRAARPGLHRYRHRQPASRRRGTPPRAGGSALRTRDPRRR